MSKANEIIAALSGNLSTGMCRCPAHDDKTPSLHVRDGRNRVVLHCHAGCPPKDVIAALRRRGLWDKKDRVRLPVAATADAEGTKRIALQLLAAAEKSTDQPKAYFRLRGIMRSPPGLKLLDRSTVHGITGRMFPAIVAPVTDKDGQIDAAHVTYLTADGKRNAIGASGKLRRMYGEVAGGFVILKDADPETPLIIGEGIDTVLSAMQITGFPGVAALSAGNMSKLRPPKAAEYIIAADNDAAGRKAAASLAERLRFEGRAVRIAVPVTDGDDWNDVLQGDDAEASWQAALDADNSGKELAGPVSALEEDKFMELAFPERELLLEPWLPRPGLAMVYAPKGEGKTWFALAVAKAVASGRDLLGWRCPTNARVLYVEGELPGQSVQGRLNKFRRSPQGNFHILCRDSYLLRRETMPDLGDIDGRQELDRIIKQSRPDVIIIDTISTLVRSGAENDAESWAPIQAWLLSHRWQGRTIILMHHSGKSGQQRGTSKREDVMDTIIKLKKQPEACTETESIFDLTFDKSRDFYGKAAEPMRLRLSTEGGRATWRGEPMRDVQADKVEEMLKLGMKQRDIAREMNVSPGRVSQIVKEIRDRAGEEVALPQLAKQGRVREKE